MTSKITTKQAGLLFVLFILLIAAWYFVRFLYLLQAADSKFRNNLGLDAWFSFIIGSLFNASLIGIAAGVAFAAVAMAYRLIKGVNRKSSFTYLLLSIGELIA